MSILFRARKFPETNERVFLEIFNPDYDKRLVFFEIEYLDRGTLSFEMTNRVVKMDPRVPWICL
jgi:hypothetical protein